MHTFLDQCLCVLLFFVCLCQNFKFMHWPSDNRLLKWRVVEVAVCLCLVPVACKWIVGLSEWWHHMCIQYFTKTIAAALPLCSCPVFPRQWLSENLGLCLNLVVMPYEYFQHMLFCLPSLKCFSFSGFYSLWGNWL